MQYIIVYRFKKKQTTITIGKSYCIRIEKRKNYMKYVFILMLSFSSAILVWFVFAFYLNFFFLVFILSFSPSSTVEYGLCLPCFQLKMTIFISKHTFFRCDFSYSLSTFYAIDADGSGQYTLFESKAFNVNTKRGWKKELRTRQQRTIHRVKEKKKNYECFQCHIRLNKITFSISSFSMKCTLWTFFFNEWQ